MRITHTLPFLRMADRQNKTPEGVSNPKTQFHSHVAQCLINLHQSLAHQALKIYLSTSLFSAPGPLSPKGIHKLPICTTELLYNSYNFFALLQVI